MSKCNGDWLLGIIFARHVYQNRVGPITGNLSPFTSIGFLLSQCVFEIVSEIVNTMCKRCTFQIITAGSGSVNWRTTEYMLSDGQFVGEIIVQSTATVFQTVWPPVWHKRRPMIMGHKFCFANLSQHTAGNKSVCQIGLRLIPVTCGIGSFKISGRG